MVKAVLKKNKVGGLSFSGFRTYHKAVVVRMDGIDVKMGT